MTITFFKIIRQLSMCLVNAINIITGTPNTNTKGIMFIIIASITLLYFYSGIFMVIANT